MKAFPQSTKYDSMSGMDLRDYFAAKALQAIIAKTPLKVVDLNYSIPEYSIAANGAYAYADAMMELRNACT